MEDKYFDISKLKSDSFRVITPCPICELGHKPKKTFYIPLKGKNGIEKDKYLKVIEGSELHKKLLNSGAELPRCWIVEG